MDQDAENQGAENTVDLIAAAERGDRSALDRLLGRHRDRLHRMVELRLDRAVAARVDASDVVQEVLLDASRRLSDYLRDPRLPFHLWLRQIARDRMIDAHRRHRGAQRRSVDREQQLEARGHGDGSSIRVFEELSAQGLTPAAAAIRSELVRRFQAALDLLQDDDREVILMRHLEQLSNQEVAAALEVKEPAASMRYLRALKHLRALLEHAGEESQG